MQGAPLTMGVEEEYFVVDAATHALRPRAEGILAVARQDAGERVEPELHLCQVECSTPVSTTLTQISEHLCRLRTTLMDAARETDSRIVAVGTHPFSDWLGQQITPKQRYTELDAEYQQLAWEQLVCGCHVHVGIDDPELAISVMNHVRPYLSTLRAVTTNSPFWQGIDTGYASYRLTIFDRWPTAGMPPLLKGRRQYDDIVESLVETGSIADASKLYWDVRPSLRYPTLEFRVADVCLTVDETVMLAGLVRALVRMALRDIEAGRRAPAPNYELLRAARWRAARYGTAGDLVDVCRRVALPAHDVVNDLLKMVHDDLVEHDEWEQVGPVLATVVERGPGSTRQRDAVGAGGLNDVVDFAVAETVGQV